MTERTCPTCGATFTTLEPDASRCPACRARLTPDDRAELRAVARWQRRFGGCILAGLAAVVVARLPDVPRTWIEPVLWTTWIATRVVVVLSGMQLMRYRPMRDNVVVPVAVGALLMLPIIPLGDVVVWALLSAAARRALLAGGIDPGWWGASDDEVCRALQLCRRCGYDLTGNVSGRCPECGTDVPPPAADERSDDPLAVDVERFGDVGGAGVSPVGGAGVSPVDGAGVSRAQHGRDGRTTPAE